MKAALRASVPLSVLYSVMSVSCREYATPPGTRVVQREGRQVMVLGCVRSMYGGCWCWYANAQGPCFGEVVWVNDLVQGSRDNVTSRTQAPHHHEDRPKGKKRRVVILFVFNTNTLATKYCVPCFGSSPSHRRRPTIQAAPRGGARIRLLPPVLLLRSPAEA
jgi:hypothetical protein